MSDSEIDDILHRWTGLALPWTDRNRLIACWKAYDTLSPIGRWYVHGKLARMNNGVLAAKPDPKQFALALAQYGKEITNEPEIQESREG